LSVPEKKKNMTLSIVRKTALAVTIGAIVAFMAVSLWLNWDGVVREGIRIRAEYLVLMLPFGLVAGVLHCLAWRLSLRSIGQRIPFGRAFSIFSIAQISRYLPGGVWNYAGVVYLGAREGISKKAGASAIAIFTAVNLFTAAIMFAVTLPWLAGSAYVVALLPVFAVLLAAGAVVILRPGIFVWLLNRALRLFKKQPISAEISRGRIVLVACIEMFNWLAAGAAHYIAFVSLGVDTPGLLPIAGAAAAAWVIGYLVLFVPNGLGVREGALALILAGYGISPVSAVGAGLIVRLLAIVAEALQAGTGAILWRVSGRKTPVSVSISRKEKE